MWGMGVTFHTFLQKIFVWIVNTIVSKCPIIVIVFNMVVGSAYTQSGLFKKCYIDKAV